ncbi:hypothetical protein [Lactiplantibacillus plantarum]|uniref:hypothetical protein n=1 Tax=Lactiplantibacillus plantarum TaxID=1590 RepID=UPI0021CAF406|nr:hypothetical protein [Lactiplantibacillus plantarum]
MDYSSLLGPDRYDLAVTLAKQYHLDPSQVLFGYCKWLVKLRVVRMQRKLIYMSPKYEQQSIRNLIIF